MEPIWSQVPNHDTLLTNSVNEKTPTELFFQSPPTQNEFWVLWSENASNQAIQDQIKLALCSYCPLIFHDLLIQFWAPEIINGRRHLTTSLQPFALHNLDNQKLIQYRKHCVGFEFVVADFEGEEEDEVMDGVLGRVFRNGLPEICPEISYYSLIDYPQRDFALSCGIESTVALPVFEHSGQTCVGVLELLLATNDFDFLDHHLDMANWALKEAHLGQIDAMRMLFQIQDAFEGHVEEEITEALKQVCKTHDLPLVVGWVSSGQLCSNDFNVSCNGELLVSVPALSFHSDNDDDELRSYCHASWSVPLKVRQGLVGKAFLSRKPYFCRNVCELRITEYPLIHFARKSGLAGSFAVSLQSITNNNHEYVVEFFLPRDNLISRDLHNLLSSVMTTLKQQLQSFEAVIGDMENEIFTEVKCGEHRNMASTSYSYVTVSTPTTSEGEETETADSSQTSEATLESTCRKPVNQTGPSCKRSKRENELVHMKVKYGEDFVKFTLLCSSRKADLVENLVMRLPILNDGDFVIKYLNESGVWILLDTDKDLQDCMVRSRSSADNPIRILLEDV